MEVNLIENFLFLVVDGAAGYPQNAGAAMYGGTTGASG